MEIPTVKRRGWGVSQARKINQIKHRERFQNKKESGTGAKDSQTKITAALHNWNNCILIVFVVIKISSQTVDLSFEKSLLHISV